MNCPKCNKSNPEDAVYCISCGATLERAPATGPTTMLNPHDFGSTDTAPAPVPPAPVQPVPTSNHPNWLGGHGNQAIGGVWLIGLGILFLTKFFWPGILLLIGVTAYLQEASNGHNQQALRNLLFFAGLTILFSTGMFWPGILILLGIIALLSPEIRNWR